MNNPITIETIVNAPLEKVWRDYTEPEAIKAWNAPSDDWHTTEARNDLRVGGELFSRMEAKDGSAGFDFIAAYTVIEPEKHLAYTISDGRNVEVMFTPEDSGVRVVTSFEAETENTRELQQQGWQAILDNFKKYVEGSD